MAPGHSAQITGFSGGARSAWFYRTQYHQHRHANPLVANPWRHHHFIKFVQYPSIEDYLYLPPSVSSVPVSDLSPKPEMNAFFSSPLASLSQTSTGSPSKSESETYLSMTAAILL
jgi:hypothetical protein